jgi:hypothetical protein
LVPGDTLVSAALVEAEDSWISAEDRLLAPLAEGKFLIPTDVTPTRCGECWSMYSLPPRA